jgi:hypothetical protein
VVAAVEAAALSQSFWGEGEINHFIKKQKAGLPIFKGNPAFLNLRAKFQCQYSRRAKDFPDQIQLSKEIRLIRTRGFPSPGFPRFGFFLRVVGYLFERALDVNLKRSFRCCWLYLAGAKGRTTRTFSPASLLMKPTA